MSWPTGDPTQPGLRSASSDPHLLWGPSFLRPTLVRSHVQFIHPGESVCGMFTSSRLWTISVMRQFSHKLQFCPLAGFKIPVVSCGWMWDPCCVFWLDFGVPRRAL